MQLSEDKLQERKKALAIIKKYHRALNAPNIVPEQCYKRNSVYYPLVSYINNITGTFLSKNLEVIPFFIKITYKEISSIIDSKHDYINTKAYIELADCYIKQMVYYMREFSQIDIDFVDAFIPDEIKNSEMQEAPSFIKEEF